MVMIGGNPARIQHEWELSAGRVHSESRKAPSEDGADADVVRPKGFEPLTS